MAVKKIKTQFFPYNLRIENLAGRKFGLWTVLGYSHRQNKHHYWVVQCSCSEGTLHTIGNSYLLDLENPSKHCGCLDPRKENLTGRHFGRWKVLKLTNTVDNARIWLCKCSCIWKTKRLIQTERLTAKTNPSTNCGCVRSEKAKTLLKRIPKIVHEYFERIDSQEKAYLFGFLWAYGSLAKARNVLSWQSKDLNVLLFAQSVIGGSIYHRTIFDKRIDQDSVANMYRRYKFD